MCILHFTASQIIDPEIEAYYRVHNTRNNVRTLHTHEYYEIHFVVKGTLKHLFADGKSHVLNVGGLLFIRPDDAHVCLSANEEECHYINIAYSLNTVFELFKFLGDGFQSKRLLDSKYPPIAHLTQEEKRQFLAKFEKIVTLAIHQTALIKTSLRALLIDILVNYYSAFHFNDEPQKPDWLLHVYDEMHKKENFILGSERMVELSEKSHHHLCREFKKHFKATPTSFLNQLRLNYAANMLANSFNSITDIALDLNFNNLSHFHHLFKKQYGVTPAVFRKEQKIR
ncbi:AraC family transcriptional regulator [Paenibacillus psychroresistens]|uniref:AraC family transcriptional regulator n=1 Tax=Paenibacillus psychroresistens TaxID=1778678 RepID=A0A6B8RSW9_9BACL|nr:AraC family transcriptional regulator [Paenibacillus psychroresistens]QGQ98416.1 AraC family transcriptional regulator [Paenibacillus psychroresistens]